MIRIAINGFGRIGRLVLRRALQDKDIRVVALNDLSGPETLAYLFKYDTVHGPFSGTVKARKDALIIDGEEVKVFVEDDLNQLPWGKLKVDVVVESTGKFRKQEDLEVHLKDGAKKVLLSAAGKGEQKIKTIVLGVNGRTYKGEAMVSNASCTTNCFAPMAKILNDAFGIVDGVMTTIHSYTNDQRVLDTPHKDLRRARGAALNIIPTSTGASEAISSVIPELKGKILGSAFRVPTPDGSVCYFAATVGKKKNPAGKDAVNSLFQAAAKGTMKGILEYSEDPIVSSDIIGNSHSCIFDSQLTEVLGNKVVIVGWYDNEWGYSCRMVDLVKLMMRK